MKKISTLLLTVTFIIGLVGCTSSGPETEPPSAKDEVMSAQPGPDFFWIPGHWEWHRGSWMWIGGHWLKHRPGGTWVAGHWVKRGRHWVWIPGHWR